LEQFAENAGARGKHIFTRGVLLYGRGRVAFGMVSMRHFLPPNVAVNCRSCGSDIPFLRPDDPADEFSLKCPKCERRAIYLAVHVRPFTDVSAHRFEAHQPPKARWLFG